MYATHTYSPPEEVVYVSPVSHHLEPLPEGNAPLLVHVILVHHRTELLIVEVAIHVPHLGVCMRICTIKGEFEVTIYISYNIPRCQNLMHASHSLHSMHHTSYTPSIHKHHHVHIILHAPYTFHPITYSRIAPVFASTDVLDVDAEEGIGEDAVAGRIGHRSVDDQHPYQCEDQSEPHPPQAHEGLVGRDKAIIVSAYNVGYRVLQGVGYRV